MDSRASYAALVEGLQSFDITGPFNPCELLLKGTNAFPVLVTTKGQVLIAASRYGMGRMVVAAHEAILQQPQLLRFLKNAVQWLKPCPEAVVGISAGMDSLSKMLLSGGEKVLADAIPGTSLGVYCTDAYADTPADDLVQFVGKGGGLLIGGQAWHWSYQHGKENVLAEFPGNRVTSVAGVYFTAEVGDNGIFPVSPEIPKIPVST